MKITKLETKLPTVSEISSVKGTFTRSSIIGIIVGIVPGAGATIASFLSYAYLFFKQSGSGSVAPTSSN